MCPVSSPVWGGERAVIFDRLRQKVLPVASGEGTHFIIPFFQKANIFSIRSTPRSIPVVTGSKGAVHTTLHGKGCSHTHTHTHRYTHTHTHTHTHSHTHTLTHTHTHTHRHTHTHSHTRTHTHTHTHTHTGPAHMYQMHFPPLTHTLQSTKLCAAWLSILLSVCVSFLHSTFWVND